MPCSACRSRRLVIEEVISELSHREHTGKEEAGGSVGAGLRVSDYLGWGIAVME